MPDERMIKTFHSCASGLVRSGVEPPPLCVPTSRLQGLVRMHQNAHLYRRFDFLGMTQAELSRLHMIVFQQQNAGSRRSKQLRFRVLALTLMAHIGTNSEFFIFNGLVHFVNERGQEFSGY